MCEILCQPVFEGKQNPPRKWTLVWAFVLPLCSAEAGALRTDLHVTVQVIEICDKARNLTFQFGKITTPRGIVKPRSTMTVCADDPPVARAAPDDGSDILTLNVIYRGIGVQ